MVGARFFRLEKAAGDESKLRKLLKKMQGIFGGREKTEQRSQQDTQDCKVFCSLICAFHYI